MVDFRRSGRGANLYKAVATAQDVLAEARVSYHRVFDAAVVGGNANGAALREQGCVYAQAVSQYANAVMEWLTYVDRNSRGTSKKGTPAKVQRDADASMV